MDARVIKILRSVAAEVARRTFLTCDALSFSMNQRIGTPTSVGTAAEG
jgi:hypothetical protein